MNDVYKDPADLHCSPSHHKFAEKNSTCFSHAELKLLAKEFNKRSPSDKHIKGRTKGELVQKLLEAYKGVCDKYQYCWVKQTLTDSEKIAKLEKAFRPKKPVSWDEDHNTWLNTFDINYVLQQYEELYKHFAYVGCYPIDFSDDSSGSCVGDILCEFDIHTHILGNKKKTFGVVFNTDPSYKGGSHWISLFCDLRKMVKGKPNKNYGIFFYDSVSNPPPKEVVAFKKKICEQVGDPKFVNRDNKIQRQFSNYDCGVYSIVFITQMLKDIPYDVICEQMKTDKYVNSFRDVLYRPNMRS